MPLILKPWLENLTIKTTSLALKKFDLDYIDPDPTIGDWGWAQRPYVAEVERQHNLGLPVRIIILKARQLGLSTATEAILFLWCFLYQGTSAGIVSHEKGSAEKLYKMTRTFWETWPLKDAFETKYHTKYLIEWLNTGSQIQVATAKSPESLRGSTIHALHGSEVAFWPDPEILWTGLNNTIPRRPGTIAVLESTANGVGNWFYEKWQEAESGSSEFVPLFFPWFGHAAYRLHNYLTTTDLELEERELYRTMTNSNSWPILSDDEALASLSWRRVEIPRQGGIERFHQEFPSTPLEAFLTTGNPIFNPSRVNDCYDPKHGAVGRLYRDGFGKAVFEDDPSGDLTIFKLPSSRDIRPDKYFISADPSENRHAGDPCSIQVINRETLEQVAVWHSRSGPIVVARQMMLIGDFYHHAMLCPEVEGGGQATIGAILQADYGNVWSWKKPDRTTASFNVWGWSTNYNTKLWAITELQQLFNSRSILIHDKLTYHELLNYVERDNGQLGNSAGTPHDDTVMALAIAVCASMREGHFKPQRTPSQHLDIFSSEFEQVADSIDNIIPIRRIGETV